MSYKKWVFIATFLFGIGLVLGLVTPTGTASIPLSEELIGIFIPFTVSTVILIFIKNVLALLLSFVLSPIFGLVPILALTVNGWLIAVVSTAVIREESLGYVLAGLLPHGIFELPALILAQAAALSFGTAAVLALFRKEKANLLLPNLRRNLRYLLVAFALLLPAAIIETYITPLLLR